MHDNYLSDKIKFCLISDMIELRNMPIFQNHAKFFRYAYRRFQTGSASGKVEEDLYSLKLILGYRLKRGNETTKMVITN